MLHSLTCLGGMVTAPHHLAAQAGLSVLRDGGNAVEAMVAAAAAIAVVYPHMNSIGGDGFWLIAEPGRDPVAVRACGASAALATPQFYADHGDAAIPTRGPRAALTAAGAVGGWARALAVAAPWGKPLPLTRLLAEARHHARQGVPVTRSQVALTASKWAECAQVSGFAETFAPRGLPVLNDVIANARLGDTLEQLGRAGLDDFYRGDLARSMAADLESVGSPVRLADLQACRAEVVPALSVAVSAGRIFNQPPPTQGVSSLAILGIFDRLGVTEAEGFEHLHGLVESTKQAFLWRNAHVGDPALMAVRGADPQAFLSDASLAARAARIDTRRAAPWPQPTLPGDTIWMGTADASGRVCSYIQSIYWEFGSGVVLAGSGVNWQNRGCSFALNPAALNALEPGRKPFHTRNPAMARLADGRTVVYGTMGGDGQPQTQCAIFTRAIAHGLPPQAAVSAPRWLLGRTWGKPSESLKLESRFDAAVVRELAGRGHDVEIIGAYDETVGHAGMIIRHADGLLEGGADPRSDGAVAAY